MLSSGADVEKYSAMHTCQMSDMFWFLTRGGPSRGPGSVQIE